MTIVVIELQTRNPAVAEKADRTALSVSVFIPELEIINLKIFGVNV